VIGNGVITRCPDVRTGFTFNAMKKLPRTPVLVLLLTGAVSLSACSSGAKAASQTTAAITAKSAAMGTAAASPATSAGSLSVGAIDHVIIGVKDLAASSTFYSTYMGWSQIAQSDANRLGLVGGIGLNLVTGGPAEKQDHTIGFKTTNIETAAAALTKGGVKFDRGEFPLPDGTINLVLMFTDPDGNKIDLVQAKK
jgi:predicted enzyme related to lactoylglutathione lyase